MRVSNPEYVVWKGSDPLTTLLCFFREGILLKMYAEGRSLARPPYQYAQLDYIQVDPSDILRTATYVLRQNLATIGALEDALKPQGFDLYDLNGMIRYKVDGVEKYAGPPVLEVWPQQPYNNRPAITDGAHRLWAARQQGRKVGCVVVSNVFHMLPVLPLENGWDGVAVFDQLPQTKRFYAPVPPPYQPPDLYRVNFPGSTGFRPPLPSQSS